MWRSLFMAGGFMLVILGFECLMIDSAVVFAASDTTAVEFVDPSAAPGPQTKEVRPSEWVPWIFLMTGAITVLYAVTLPRRFGIKQGGE